MKVAIHAEPVDPKDEEKAKKAVDVADDYEVKDHLATLAKADQIRNDPEKMRRVNELVGRHHKAVSGMKKIKSVKDIKDYAQKKFGPSKDADGDQD